MTVNTDTWDNTDLSVDEERNLNNLEREYLAREISITPEQQAFLEDKLGSKLWRMSNLYTIRDKDGVKRLLILNYSQERILTKFKHNKKIILKSRQQGISTLYLAYYLDSCLFQPGYQAGIQSYGQDEADKLAKRALLMWDELDQDVKDILGIKIVSNNQKGMTFSNGSILKIGNFRGDTLQALHVSELGKIAKKYPEKAKELKTGAFQAVGKNNKITIESTAEGKTGLFYEMWQKATTRELSGLLGPFDFQPIFLSWLDDPDCNIDFDYEISRELTEYFEKLEAFLSITINRTQKNWYVSKQDELGEDMKQEYPTYPEEAFEQTVEGMYYKNEFPKLKLLSNLYDPNLIVNMAFDLGINDDFSIGFSQSWYEDVQGTQRGERKLYTRIIGEYRNSGFGLTHYAEVCASLAKTKGFVYGKTYVPHDITVRELITGTTRWDALLELGFNPVLVPKHSVADGIECVRQFLKEVEIDKIECPIILGAIQNYRKKFDKQLEVFLDSPLHDEWSHPADMLRYKAMGITYSPPSESEILVLRKPNKAKISRDYDV